MLNHTEEDAVLQKTKELCQAILDQPALTSARESVTAFMDDAPARRQYEEVLAQSQELRRKQESGLVPSPAEISTFERSRDRLLSDPVARGFLDAQEQLHQVHQTVTNFVGKTLELGRVPTAEDLHSECCGSGCGCEH